MIISSNSNPEINEYDHVEVKTLDGGHAFFCRDAGDRWCDFNRPYVLNHMGLVLPRNCYFCRSGPYLITFIMSLTLMILGFSGFFFIFEEYAFFYATIGIFSPFLFYLYVTFWYQGRKRAKLYNVSRIFCS